MDGLISATQPETAAEQDPVVDTVLGFKRRYLRYPAVNQVEADLARLFKYGSLGRQTGTSASTYMLVGDPGSGKTALLRRFCQAHPMRQEPERDVHPVLYVEVPPRTTRKALAERILAALGAPVPSNATEIRLTARAVDNLRKQDVRVLVLDEAQHLVIPEKRRLNYEAADWVKGIANSGACAVALAGVPDAWEAYLYNGQLRRRSFGNRRLSAFRVTDGREWRTFRGLLKAFDKVLPFGEPSNLGAELTALRLHRQVFGLIGRLSDFLVVATILGLEEGAPCLTDEVLGEAAQQLADIADPNWTNPFDMDEEALRDAAVRAEEERAILAGVARPTGLRRGKRALTQRDVLG